MTLRIFISYRRADKEGQYLAHMIFSELCIRYGDASAFLDVDSSKPGLSFPKKVQSALESSNAVFVVIGPEWLSLLKERANDERDWVRYEVSESLRRPELPVVPVSHVNAKFPTASELPPEIRDLAYRDGVSLDPFRGFKSNLARLLQDLEHIVTEQLRQTQPADAGATPEAGADAQLFDQFDPFGPALDDVDAQSPPASHSPAASMSSAESPAIPANGDESEDRYVGHAAPLHDHGMNPLLALANRMLLLAPQLARTAHVDDVSALRARVVHGLHAFDDAAKQCGILPDHITVARYVLCAALDEAVLSTRWGSSGVWSRSSLSKEFFNDSVGGEKVFKLISLLAEAPAANLDLLEMMHALLTLGFEGRYRVIQDGAAQRAALYRRLGETIITQRGAIGANLEQSEQRAASMSYAQ